MTRHQDQTGGGGGNTGGDPAAPAPPPVSECTAQSLFLSPDTAALSGSPAVSLNTCALPSLPSDDGVSDSNRSLCREPPLIGASSSDLRTYNLADASAHNRPDASQLLANGAHLAFLSSSTNRDSVDSDGSGGSAASANLVTVGPSPPPPRCYLSPKSTASPRSLLSVRSPLPPPPPPPPPQKQQQGKLAASSSLGSKDVVECGDGGGGKTESSVPWRSADNASGLSFSESDEEERYYGTGEFGRHAHFRENLEHFKQEAAGGGGGGGRRKVSLEIELQEGGAGKETAPRSLRQLSTASAIADSVPHAVAAERLRIVGETERGRLSRLIDETHGISRLRRRALHAILVSPWFDGVTITLIVMNCVANAAIDPTDVDGTTQRNRILLVVEMVFTFAFCVEAALRCTVQGLVRFPYSYFNDKWNVFDFVIVVASTAALAVELGSASNGSGLIALRTFRVLRPLKAISRIRALQLLILVLLHSLRSLVDVLTLYVFFLSVCGIVAVQLWAGSFSARCVPWALLTDATNPDPDRGGGSADGAAAFALNYTAVAALSGGNAYLAELISWGRVCSASATVDFGYHCPWGHECVGGVGNPQHGFLSFDHMGWAVLTLYRVVAMEAWTDVMTRAADGTSYFAALYFVSIVFMGSCFIANLVLVTIATVFFGMREGQDAAKQAVEASEEAAAAAAAGAVASTAAQVDEMSSTLAALRRGTTDASLALVRRRSVMSSFAAASTEGREGGGLSGGGGLSQRLQRSMSMAEVPKGRFARRAGRSICVGDAAGSNSARHCASLSMSASGTGHPLPAGILRRSVDNPLLPPLFPRPPAPLPQLRVPSNVTTDAASATNSLSAKGSPAMSPDNGGCSGSGGGGGLSGGGGVPLDWSACCSLPPGGGGGGGGAGGGRSGSPFSASRASRASAFSLTSPGTAAAATAAVSSPGVVGSGGLRVSPRLLEVRHLDSVVPGGEPESGRAASLGAAGAAALAAAPPVRAPRGAERSLLSVALLPGLPSDDEDGGESTLRRVVASDLFNSALTVAVAVNTILLASEFHGQGDAVTQMHEAANIVFTCVFAVETSLKICAFRWAFFRDRVNLFDAAISLLAAAEVAVSYTAGEGATSGISVFRAFRLMRLFKLAKQFPELWLTMAALANSLEAVSFLTLLLALVIFVYAQLGMHIFGGRFCGLDDQDQAAAAAAVAAVDGNASSGVADDAGGVGCVRVPRSNYDTLGWALLTTFQIITSDNWSAVMYDGMRASTAWAALYYVSLFTVGNYIVLSLFVAVLINNSQFAPVPANAGDVGLDLDPDETSVSPSIHMIGQALSSSGGTRLDQSHLTTTTQQQQPGFATRLPACAQRFLARMSGVAVGLEEETTSSIGLRRFIAYLERTRLRDVASLAVVGSSGRSSGSDTPLSPTSNILASPRFQPQIKASKERQLAEETALLLEACPEAAPMVDVFGWDELRLRFAQNVYELQGLALLKSAVKFAASSQLTAPRYRALFLVSSSNPVRVVLSRVVEHTYFEMFVVVLIAASTVSLAMYNPISAPDTTMNRIGRIVDLTLGVCFCVEAAMKIFAYGFVLHPTAYLRRDTWNRIDFLIVVLLLPAMLIEGASDVTVFRILRTFRPLRFINKSKGMQLVLDSLISSLVPMVHILLVTVLIFLLFAILGVHFFKGRFYSCTEVVWGDVSYRADGPLTHREECLSAGYRWENTAAHFDHVGAALFTLFQLSTLEGWVKTMHLGMDAVGVGRAPEKNSQPWMALYFLVWIVVGSFFIVNLFIGVLIDHYDFLRAKGVRESFLGLSAEQTTWVEIQNVIYAATQKRTQTVKRRLTNRVSRVLRTVTLHPAFERVFAGVIVANAAVIASEYSGQSQAHTDFLELANAVFVGVYTVEVAIRAGAHGVHFLVDTWARFDVFIVVVAYVGLIVNYRGGDNLSMIASVFRLLRLFRLTKVLRATNEVRNLLRTFWLSLPSLVNVAGLLTLLYCLYAIAGLNLFGKVSASSGLGGRHNGGGGGGGGGGGVGGGGGESACLDAYTSFHNFPKALLLLIKLSTGEHWDCVLEDVSVTNEPRCSHHLNTCGNPVAARFFFFTFMLIVMYVMLNVVIAVILGGYDTVQEEEQQPVTQEDMDSFFKVLESVQRTAAAAAPPPPLRQPQQPQHSPPPVIAPPARQPPRAAAAADGSGSAAEAEEDEVNGGSLAPSPPATPPPVPPVPAAAAAHPRDQWMLRTTLLPTLLRRLGVPLGYEPPLTELARYRNTKKTRLIGVVLCEVDGAMPLRDVLATLSHTVRIPWLAADVAGFGEAEDFIGELLPSDELCDAQPAWRAAVRANRERFDSLFERAPRRSSSLPRVVGGAFVDFGDSKVPRPVRYTLAAVCIQSAYRALREARGERRRCELERQQQRPHAQELEQQGPAAARRASVGDVAMQLQVARSSDALDPNRARTSALFRTL